MGRGRGREGVKGRGVGKGRERGGKGEGRERGGKREREMHVGEGKEMVTIPVHCGGIPQNGE